MEVAPFINPLCTDDYLCHLTDLTSLAVVLVVSEEDFGGDSRQVLADVRVTFRRMVLVLAGVTAIAAIELRLS